MPPVVRQRPTQPPPPELTDQELLGRYRDGEEDAFDALYDRYRPRLVTYAARLLGRVQDAEDLTTEAFVRLVERGPRTAEPGSLRGYLFTVLHRLCLDRLRRWERRGRLLQWFGGAQARPSTPEAELVIGERDAALQCAIGRLPAKHRSAILLTYAEGMGSSDVGDVLGCTDQQVRSRLAYARRLLRADLEAGDGDT